MTTAYTREHDCTHVVHNTAHRFCYLWIIISAQMLSITEHEVLRTTELKTVPSRAGITVSRLAMLVAKTLT